MPKKEAGGGTVPKTTPEAAPNGDMQTSYRSENEGNSSKKAELSTGEEQENSQADDINPETGEHESDAEYAYRQKKMLHDTIEAQYDQAALTTPPAPSSDQTRRTQHRASWRTVGALSAALFRSFVRAISGHRVTP